jgi:hypothetical protein
MGSLKISSVMGAACESSAVGAVSGIDSFGGPGGDRAEPSIPKKDVVVGIGANMGVGLDEGVKAGAGIGIGVGAWIGAGVEVKVGLMARSMASVVGGGVGAKSGGDDDCGLFLLADWVFVCGRLGSRFRGGNRELSAGAGVFDVGYGVLYVRRCTRSWPLGPSCSWNT